VIDYFDAKVQLDPKNAEAWFSKALAEEKLGRHETAIHSYTRFCNFVSSEAAGLIELAQQRIRALT
jgi:tetratricopeptide (TPR) repeat protein